VILEVNPVPGFLDIFGEGPRRETLKAVYDWVEKNIESRLTRPASAVAPAG
jgi:hypothetical protein